MYYARAWLHEAAAAPVEVRPLIPLQVVGIAFAEFLASMRMLTATEQSTPPVKSHDPD